LEESKISFGHIQNVPKAKYLLGMGMFKNVPMKKRRKISFGHVQKGLLY
jgi:hypothetical protein